jgi:D-arabinose 1-dehydrogenase-like Zn-dependent alcohol dehydrogenase
LSSGCQNIEQALAANLSLIFASRASSKLNALRNTGAKPPDTVAILGMGGLGHLWVQFAAKMGFNTVAIARGADKEKFAHDLGARHYIDSTSADVGASLQKLGGARVILATVTDADADPA